MSSSEHTPPRNGLGTAGFVVGLIGLVFAFIPIIGVIAWPLVIIGLVLSLVGLVRANKGRATNKGMAISGVSVSAVGLVICIVWLGALGSAIDEVEENKLKPTDSAQTPAEDQPDSTQTSAEDEHTAMFSLSTEQAVNVRYGDFGDTQTEVVQPTEEWTQTFTFAGGSHYLSLSATPVDSSNYTSQITCTITVDGEQVAQHSNPFGALCNANVDK